MRKLKTSDIPAFCRCLENMGVKDVVQKVAKDADTGADIWDRGFDLIWSLIGTVTDPAGERELYTFLSGIFEMTPDEVSDLPIPDLMNNLKMLAQENDLAAFFKPAAAALKQMS